MPEIVEIRQKLEGIVSALKLDGYDLKVERAGKHLDLRIGVLENACEDCLSPPSIFARVISGALKGQYSPENIRISYPTDK